MHGVSEPEDVLLAKVTGGMVVAMVYAENRRFGSVCSALRP